MPQVADAATRKLNSQPQACVDCMVQQVQYIHNAIALGTLGAKSSITDGLPIDGSRLQGIRIKKLMYNAEFIDKSAANGPISWGLAVGLSAAEVAEAIEADPQGEMDVPATDQGNRRVFPIGTIGVDAVNSDVTPDSIKEYREIKFPWKKIPEGVGLFMFAHNHGLGALTTGTLITAEFVFVYEWLDD